jgi:hypothetical protein
MLLFKLNRAWLVGFCCLIATACGGMVEEPTQEDGADAGEAALVSDGGGKRDAQAKPKPSDPGCPVPGKNPDYPSCYKAGATTAQLPCLPPTDPKTTSILGKQVSGGPWIAADAECKQLCCYNPLKSNNPASSKRSGVGYQCGVGCDNYD